ncbi:hypothetical protein GFC01_14810 [Desulfofundulus thermobenzoicus]|uniref:O-antigen ligase-related domain-containing protein n=1 Tax=Desulfofundulus thermobenzoicus TaxID=29376 RepID=A0A6N7IVM4_9FIRM|nr:O-antigen ligase family protein [Desulfofundulus thermobenzoicus]MQL53507.1 hypothetical protein [Desulfofundulus thermobenzoicus]
MDKELILLLVCGTVVFLLALVRPAYALTITLGANFFLQPRPQIAGVYVILADAAIVALTLAWIFRSIASERLTFPRTGLELAFGVLAGAYILSAVFAFDHGRALVKTVQLVEWVLLFYLTVNYGRGEKTLRLLVGTLIGVGLFEVALAAYQAARMEDFRRVTGTLGNDLGWYMFMLLLFAMVQFVTYTELKHRLLWAVAGIFFTFGFLLTQVRELWFSLLVALLVLAILEAFIHRRPKRFLRFLGVVAVSGAAGIILLLPKLGPYLVYLENRSLDTLYTRLGQWGSALNIFAAHPWAGIGPGGFGQLWVPFIPETYYSLCVAYGLVGNSEIDAHSFLFTRLAETGLLGTAAAVWVLWRLARRTARVKGLSLPPLAQGIAITARLLAVLALLTLVYSDFFQIKLFWMLVGLGLSCRSFAAGTVRPEAKAANLRPSPHEEGAYNFGC